MSDTVPPQPTAAQAWARALEAWRIPDEIMQQAPTSPWIHPVELFRAGEEAGADSPSHRAARQALPVGGSVLDVGCGGGRAAFALCPPASRVIGVDHQGPMLEEFASAAQRRGLGHAEVLGEWPAVAGRTEAADVVVCHHVAYNVAALAPFALALTAHARRRVVLELPERHPLSHLNPLWRRFWGLERPSGPTAQDAAAVLEAEGLAVHSQAWDEEQPRAGAALPWSQQVAFMRTRLCLTPERDPEVAEAMRSMPGTARRLVTMWWEP